MMDCFSRSVLSWGVSNTVTRQKSVPPAAVPNALWAVFSLWALFVLVKAFSGAGKIVAAGFSFLSFAPWSSWPRAVPLSSLALDFSLDAAALLALAAAAQGWGALALRGLRFSAQESLLAQSLGLGVLSLSTLIGSALGLPLKILLPGALAGGLLLLAVFRPSWDKPSQSPPWSALELVFAALLAYALLLHLLGARAPETFYDSLAYHLAVPKFYLELGKIAPLPDFLHANFPQNGELLYLYALFLRGEGAAKAVHLWAFLLSLAWIFSFARAALTRRAALGACLLFASVPVLGAAVWHTGVELFTTLWGLAGSLLLLKAAKDEKAPLAASGILLGLAMGAKYTGLWPTAAAAVFLARSYPPRALFNWGLAAAAVLSPWLVKNWLYAGNPVYPFLGSLFPVPADAAAFSADALGHFWTGGALSWKTWLWTPWEMFLKGRSSFSFIGPILVLFAPLALFRRNFPAPLAWLLALFGIHYALWASSTSMVRLLIPALPLFCLWAAGTLGARGSWLIVPVAVWNLSWCAAMLNEIGAPAPALGWETRTAYLAKPGHSYHYPLEEIAAWAGKNIPDSAVVLLSGDARAYPIPRRTIAASVFDQDPLLKRLKNAGSAAELSAGLQAEGIGFVVVNHGEAYRTRGKDLKMLPPEKLRLLDDFFRKHTETLRDDGKGVALFALKKPTGPSSAPVAELVRVAVMSGARLPVQP